MVLNFSKLARMAPALLAVAVLAGCAVSPQQVPVEPQTGAEFPTAARNGIAVNLSVEDARETNVLGSLGGLYADSSTLSASNDLAADLRAVLADKLTRAGYQVTRENGDFRMDVAIDQLNYQREPGSVSSEIRVVADLGVRIEDDTVFLERNYRSGSNQTRITRPTPADNRMFLEEALNDSLSRMIRDERLHEFLRR